MGSTPLEQRRLVNRYDRSQILIYTDSSCLSNGRAEAQAGCGVVFRESEPGINGYLTFRLENRDPSGELHPQTSNRAEMRAVLVKGATEWVYRWQQNGWYTARGPVRNMDLWMALWEEFIKWADLGLQLYFWKIPRDLNTEADHWAREGAIQDETPSFATIHGIML